jgi:hypothetical protein
MRTVTVHVFEPVTETLRLYQLLPTVPADNFAVQLPPELGDGELDGLLEGELEGLLEGLLEGDDVVVGELLGCTPPAFRALRTEV